MPFNIGEKPFNLAKMPFNIGETRFNIGEKPFNIGETRFNIGKKPFNIGDIKRLFADIKSVLARTRGVSLSRRRK